MSNNSSKAKWYVYDLIDPSTGLVFYIGKGSGDRIHSHGKKSDVVNKEKCSIIRKIGYSRVVRKKVALFWCEEAALLCEAERICEYKDNGALTNYISIVSSPTGEIAKVRNIYKKKRERVMLSFNIMEFYWKKTGECDRSRAWWAIQEAKELNVSLPSWLRVAFS